LLAWAAAAAGAAGVESAAGVEEASLEPAAKKCLNRRRRLQAGQQAADAMHVDDGRPEQGDVICCSNMCSSQRATSRAGPSGPIKTRL
jgi:hypothetical protein